MDRDSTKIAIVVGVPVLVGAAAYYYYYHHLSSDDAAGTNKQSPKKIPLAEQAMKLKELGNKSFSMKIYDDAITHYSEAIKIACEEGSKVKQTDLAIFYQNRAACFEALKKFEDVIQDCSLAIDANKKYVKAYLRRAKAYKSLEKYEEAIVDAHVANFLEKFQNQSSLDLAEECANAMSKTKASERVKTCVDLWPSKQDIKNYFISYSLDPMFEKNGNQPIQTGEELKELYKQANDPANEEVPIWNLIKGSCLALMGKNNEAKEYLDKIITCFDDSDEMRNIKSNALLKKSSIILAELTSVENMDACLARIFELLDEAKKVCSKNPDVLLFRAKTYMLWDKPESALEALNEAIELNPEFKSAIAHRLYIEFKLAAMANETPKKTLEKCKEVIQKYPESIDIRTIYAQILLEMNQFEKADEELLNIAKLNPGEADPILTRALIYMQLGDTKKAGSLFEEAKAIAPNNKTIYDFLGSIEAQKGNMDEAIKFFRTGLENCCRTEEEFQRFYSLIESCKGHKAATDILSKL